MISKLMVTHTVITSIMAKSHQMKPLLLKILMIHYLCKKKHMMKKNALALSTLSATNTVHHPPAFRRIIFLMSFRLQIGGICPLKSIFLMSFLGNTKAYSPLFSVLLQNRRRRPLNTKVYSPLFSVLLQNVHIKMH